jgi:hypothetical protein
LGNGSFSEKDPNGEEGDGKKVVEEDERLLDQASEESDGSVNVA